LSLHRVKKLCLQKLRFSNKIDYSFTDRDHRWSITQYVRIGTLKDRYAGYIINEIIPSAKLRSEWSCTPTTHTCPNCIGKSYFT